MPKSLEGAVALPALQGMQRETDLVTLWKTGKCPGLTDARRLLCLGQLLHRAGRYREVAETRAELERLPAGPFVSRAMEQLKALEQPERV